MNSPRRSAFAALLFLAATAARGQDLPTIEWDPATVRLIERGGDYARMARLTDGRIACAFDRRGKVWIRVSNDDGKTWGDSPTLVAEEPDTWLTNSYLLQLGDGPLLCFWNHRPTEAVRRQHAATRPGELTRPFLIRMSRSTDGGRTWAPPRTLYTAGTNFHDGCWEPAAIQLPSGEVHVYFANEGPYTTTNEQEITLLRSTDAGQTWSPPERIGFRARHRDGMPNPLLLSGNRGIAVAVEDDGLSGGRFKPVILHTTVEDDWRTGPVPGDSPRRWGALAQPIPPQWYGGAPFLAKLPSGHTILSYQESEDGSLATCRMAVCVGDANARYFTHKTHPLPRPEKTSHLWNALFVKDANAVMAVLGTTIDSVRGIWVIDGRVKMGKPAETGARRDTNSDRD